MLWTAFHPSTRTRVLYLREAGMEGTMTPVTTIGLDIAKTVFQVHGVNAAGQVVVRQRLTGGRVLAFFEKLTPCLVGIEACGNSHYWARELTARGHVVRLMPAQYVKLCQAREERRGGCRGDLRGCRATHDALCAREYSRAAKRDDAASGQVDAQSPADPAFQFYPLSSL